MSDSIKAQILAKIKNNKAGLQAKNGENTEANQSQAQEQSARIEAIKSQYTQGSGAEAKNKIRAGFSRTPVSVANKISGAA